MASVSSNLKVVIKNHSVALITAFKKNLIGYSNTLWKEDIITEAAKETILDPSKDAGNSANDLVTNVSRTFGGIADITKQTALMKNLVKVLEGEGENELVSSMRDQLSQSFNISFQMFYDNPSSDLDSYPHPYDQIAYSEPAMVDTAFYGQEDSYTYEPEPIFEMDSNAVRFDKRSRFVGIQNRHRPSQLYKQMVLPQSNSPHLNRHAKNSDPVIGSDGLTRLRHITTYPNMKPPANRGEKHHSCIPIITGSGNRRPMLSCTTKRSSFSPKQTTDFEPHSPSLPSPAENSSQYGNVSLDLPHSTSVIHHAKDQEHEITSSSAVRAGLEKEELEISLMNLKEWISTTLTTQTAQIVEKLEEIWIKKEELLMEREKVLSNREKCLELQKLEFDKLKDIEMKLIMEQKACLFEKERRVEQQIYVSLTFIIVIVAIAFVLFSRFW